MRLRDPLLCLLALAILAERANSQAARLNRVPTHELRIRTPGVAVIRDSVTWALLWRRYEQLAWVDTGIVHATVPVVDFREHMLVAVALGSTSGCGNVAHYVRRIVERSDSVVVVFGPAHEGEELTCMMLIDPVDVVRLPRSSKPVAFRPDRGELRVPPPARWWLQPQPAELDRMPVRERVELMLALARDPATPLETLEAIARRLARADSHVGADLLRRADARSNAALVTGLFRLGSDVGRQAGEVLFAQHGTALAGDPGTSADILALLVGKLGGQWTLQRQQVAELLLRNATVRANRELLGDYIYWVQPHPTLSREACRVYLAQWSRWERVLTEDGRPTDQMQTSLACPEPPRSPRE
jgi:hypothetical protein